MPDVQLVSMPFGDVFSPSIALSLLQPQLRRRGISCDILYLTLPYAERIGHQLYRRVSDNSRGTLHPFAGEWIFSGAVHSRPPAAERAYVREILHGKLQLESKPWTGPMTAAHVRGILRAKRCVPRFLDACVKRVLAAPPRILGLTSVFQQHMASLALAKRIKARRPDTLIVFGGANAEGVMGAETLRQYPFVDAIVSGEADEVFPELVQRALAGGRWDDLPGVLSQHGVRQAFAFGRFPAAPTVTDLDALPHPDYADYFAQFNRTRFSRAWRPNLPIETSRGCWWGERMHCTFCGLNGSTMTFRSKSADRALVEFEALARAHRESRFQVVDNILDLHYFTTLLPALAKTRLKLDLFYETKSNLKKTQVKLLRESGVTSIQPGIESFSDAVLKLMKKGVSGLQNVQLLKWCKQYGVEPRWNFLFGFPGEPPEEYRRMAALVPLLMHLPGPKGFGNIRLDRFSPNFFDAAAHGFTNVRPMPAYRFLHDVPEYALGNLAYHFAYDYRQPTDVSAYVRGLVPRLKAWGRGGGYELLSIDDRDMLVLVDTRPCARAPLTVLSGLDREIYLACDAVTELEAMVKTVAAAGYAVTREALARRLAAMVDRRVVLADGSRYLALAVPLGDYTPSGAAASMVLAALSRLGTRHRATLRVALDRSDYHLEAPPRRRRRARRRVGRFDRIRLSRADVRITRRELRIRRRRSPA